MTPSAAIRDRGKDLASCVFSMNGSVTPEDMKIIVQAYSVFQSGGPKGPEFTQIEIQSIYENKGASGLDFLTAFSLGIIPSFRFDEAAYLVKITQERQLVVKFVRHEIVSDMLIWLPAIPFAFWPQSNEDRLIKKLRAIFADYCNPSERTE